jgi:hypothetical protein
MDKVVERKIKEEREGKQDERRRSTEQERTKI